MLKCGLCSLEFTKSTSTVWTCICISQHASSMYLSRCTLSASVGMHSAVYLPSTEETSTFNSRHVLSCAFAVSPNETYLHPSVWTTLNTQTQCCRLCETKAKAYKLCFWLQVGVEVQNVDHIPCIKVQNIWPTCQISWNKSKVCTALHAIRHIIVISKCLFSCQVTKQASAQKSTSFNNQSRSLLSWMPGQLKHLANTTTSLHEHSHA